MILPKQLLLTIAACATGMVTSCREAEPAGASAPESGRENPGPGVAVDANPESEEVKEEVTMGHEQVVDRFLEIKRDFLESLMTVEDATSAKKFASALAGRRGRLQTLLAAAEALPPPGEGVRQSYQARQEDFSNKSAPLMDAFFARVRLSPDRDEIQEVLESLSEDLEAEALNRKLAEIYQSR